jgi:hypothetical protein
MALVSDPFAFPYEALCQGAFSRCNAGGRRPAFGGFAQEKIFILGRRGIYHSAISYFCA